MNARWSEVDHYFERLLLGDDPALDEALRANAAAGLPAHDVSPAQGKLLMILARAVGARAILEIGTLGGYSTIWLARALPAGGKVTTLEIDPARAEVARANLARAGLADAALVKVGRALDILPTLEGPFDFVFVDADKENNAEYLGWALRLARKGALVVADNVVREGRVLDAESADPSVRGVRRFAEALGREARLSATAIQTVGVKGHDGFAVAIVD